MESPETPETPITKEIEELIVKSDKWIEHIAEKGTPLSHKMFAAESYFKAFWQNAEHAMLLLDENFKIVDVNPAFCELVQITAAEATTKSFRELVPDYRFRTDYVNIKSIIHGDQYSFSGDNDIKEEFSNKKLIPVRIVATRVPANLHHNFKHIIMHIYELSPYNEQYLRQPKPDHKETWGDVFRCCLKKHFVAALITLSTILILAACAGGLNPLLQKLLETFN